MNVHLLFKKHFINLFFVFSVVFEKKLENSVKPIVREIRHVLTKFTGVNRKKDTNSFSWYFKNWSEKRSF